VAAAVRSFAFITAAARIRRATCMYIMRRVVAAEAEGQRGGRNETTAKKRGRTITQTPAMRIFAVITVENFVFAARRAKCMSSSIIIIDIHRLA